MSIHGQFRCTSPDLFHRHLLNFVFKSEISVSLPISGTSGLSRIGSDKRELIASKSFSTVMNGFHDDLLNLALGHKLT